MIDEIKHAASRVVHCGDYGNCHYNESNKVVVWVMGDCDYNPGWSSVKEIDTLFKQVDGVDEVFFLNEYGPSFDGAEELLVLFDYEVGHEVEITRALPVDGWIEVKYPWYPVGSVYEQVKENLDKFDAGNSIMRESGMLGTTIWVNDDGDVVVDPGWRREPHQNIINKLTKVFDASNKVTSYSFLDRTKEEDQKIARQYEEDSSYRQVHPNWT